ncbi:3-hydroxyacyl-CoA dehydrogenase family protein [Reichenbachiella versicolor]|uniref:3-hydroxyacyl-CoA dehydrogenase family protein n=1 Tax=Reichenbachiella versicolor TaxID=1821036 RepID=UPI000D6E8F83|nr:3-hydroxyacyl-CoA dehydrogenase NAD-binding domain-containing protein [Reichenbachiella versicolor]
MKNISVVGAGTMGNGIAHVFAQKGFQVQLIDTSSAALQKAEQTINTNLDRLIKKEKITLETKQSTLSNLSTNTNIRLGVEHADLVVETVTENPQIKLDLFKQLDKLTNNNCILASNTSSISLTKIAASTTKMDKVIGMHFMNPVPVMQLIEIIKGYETSDETTENIIDVSKKLGKTPVVVNDYPGFVANRILMPMINESIFSLFEGVAGVEEIDTVMKLGMAHQMGPLQLADFIGLDVCLAILNVMFDGFKNPKYAPCPLLINMVEAGKLGRKTGQGFYRYVSGSKELIVADRFKK